MWTRCIHPGRGIEVNLGSAANGTNNDNGDNRTSQFVVRGYMNRYNTMCN